METTSPTRKRKLRHGLVGLGAATLMFGLTACSAEPPSTPAATEATQAANAAVLEQLPFANKADFKAVRRGRIAALPNHGIVKRADGTVIWDLHSFQYGQNQAAPDTANPSLWREQQLMSVGGLFEVAPHLYQVRGYGVANMTIVEGKMGLIIIDTTLTKETAKAAIDLYRAHRGNKPIVAIIYTHSHADHFGGAGGLVTPKEVAAGKVQIIAPQDFMKESVSENVFAGTVMARRASYQFGNLLPHSATGTLGAGLGLGTAAGTVTLLPPTIEIGPDDKSLTVDGLTFEFMLAPETEAPAEMAIYIPKYKALTLGEDVNHLMHNLYTLRGAKPRNALNWAHALNDALHQWGDKTSVLFNMHTWPVWGQDNIAQMLKLQRDMYKYLNDQTLRLANLGYNMNEAAETIKLPPSLSNFWANRPYYGSVSHNVKGVWSFYLGWFDGNPARLHPLPPSQAGKKFVEYMGGVDSAINKARNDFDQGNYRWVAQVLDKVVSAYPDNQKAKNLLADAETQLGFQSENAIWRNFYLSGAKELRHGIDKHISSPNTKTLSLMRQVPVPSLLQALAIRINGPKAAGHQLAINLNITDQNKRYGLVLENAVLHTQPAVADPDLTLTMSKDALLYLLSGKVPMAELIKAGKIQSKGDLGKFKELSGLLDQFDFWWSIVLPHPGPAQNG